MTTIPCNALWPHTARGTVQSSPSNNAGYIKLSVHAGPSNYATVLVKEEDWRILSTPEVQKADRDVPLPQTP